MATPISHNSVMYHPYFVRREYTRDVLYVVSCAHTNIDVM